MTDVRYVGTVPWNRVYTKDDGSFSHSEAVMPGDKVSLDKDAAAKFTNPVNPRSIRTFVELDGPEDTYSDKYNPGMVVTGNATRFPELDMGSTVNGRPQFLREEDGGAAADEGTPSDNEEAILREEAQRDADDAIQKARDKQAAARKASAKERETSSNAGREGPNTTHGAKDA